MPATRAGRIEARNSWPSSAAPRKPVATVRRGVLVNSAGDRHGTANPGPSVESSFDICVVGHLTKDRIHIGDRAARIAPGGAAYYAALTYSRLGLNVAVVTKLNGSDASKLVEPLQSHGIEVFAGDSASTTEFENIYPDSDLGHRLQRVRSVAATLGSEDLASVDATAYHFGPLTVGDMSSGLWNEAARRGRLVVLDVQGLLRQVMAGEVHLQDWRAKAEDLAHVDVLKADGAEAATLSGSSDPEQASRALAAYGPNEVLVTCGADGSVIFAHGRLHRIPAYPPPVLENATGCGDTYLAAYVARRLQGDVADRAGRFAAAAASLALGYPGPFEGDFSTVETFLATIGGELA